MDAAAARYDRDAHFAEVLRPHRSLGPRGILWAVVPPAIVAGIGCIIFAVAGAWPISGFLGLDILLLYVALRYSLGSAVRQEERIRLTADALVVQYRAGRRLAEHRFNPYWVRLSHEEEVEGRTRLTLTSHGRSIVIGRYLSQPQREALWRRLDRALAAHRRTGFIH
jgi:uncharacterized membrane protein